MIAPSVRTRAGPCPSWEGLGAAGHPPPWAVLFSFASLAVVVLTPGAAHPSCLGCLGGAPPTPPHCCYLGLNKDFLPTPALSVLLGGKGGCRGGPGPCPLSHAAPWLFSCPSLDPRPGRELGLGWLIRAPRVPQCHGTCCKQPRAAPQPWGGCYRGPTPGGSCGTVLQQRLLALLPAPFPLTPRGRSCPCLSPPPSPGCPSDAPSCPGGSRPVTGTHVSGSAPGCRKGCGQVPGLALGQGRWLGDTKCFPRRC